MKPPLTKFIDFKGSWKWAKEHPVTAILFALIGLGIGWCSEYEGMMIPSILVAVVVFTLMALVIDNDVRKWTPLVLAFSFAIPSKAEPQPAPIVVGCLVVAVGVGIVGCQLNKLCKRKFGTPKTNAPPSELTNSDTDAAVICVHHKKSCDDVPSLLPGDHLSTAVTISGRLVEGESGPEISSIALKLTPEDQMVDFGEYQQRMANMGLTACTTSGCESYGHNGSAVLKEISRISFGRENGVPTFAIAGFRTARVAIERSFDLQTWDTLSIATMPVGSTLVFGDNSDGPSAFYRMRIEP